MLRASRYLPVALVAIGLTIATSACASQSYGYRRGTYRDIQQRAYDTGYREGLDNGLNDARRGREFNYARAGAYRDADDGYSRSLGDRDEYRRVFRQGYVAGYTEGYRGSRSGSYGRDYPR